MTRRRRRPVSSRAAATAVICSLAATGTPLFLLARRIKSMGVKMVRVRAPRAFARFSRVASRGGHTEERPLGRGGFVRLSRPAAVAVCGVVMGRRPRDIARASE